MDLGWNLVGYIQDGLSVPFGPTEIGSRVLQGGQKWLFSHSRPLGERTISGSGDYKWLDFNGYRLDLGGIHQGWSVGAVGEKIGAPNAPVTQPPLAAN